MTRDNWVLRTVWFVSMAFAALVTTLVTPGVTTGAGAAEVDLRLFHGAAPRSAALTLFLKPWAQRVEARSGGRLRIALVARPAAGGLLAALDAGEADLVWTRPGLSPGRFPATETFELPFMAASAEAGSQALGEVLATRLAGEYAGLHVVLLHAEPPAWLHGAGAPLRRLADLRGKTIYAPTRQMRRALDAWGAEGVAFPRDADAAAALKAGRIDGAVLPFAAASAAGIADAARFHTRASRFPGLSTTIRLLAMNRARYDALPDDLRRAIDGDGGLAAQVGRTWDSVEKLALKKSRTGGHVFYELGTAETGRWRVSVQPVLERWRAGIDAAGGDGAGLLTAVRAALARYEVVRETVE